MDPNDDLEIDPAIAAAMGFAGFGSQTNKKRKFNNQESFVADAPLPSSATGANSVPPGKKKEVQHTRPDGGNTQQPIRDSEAAETAGPARTLEALRYGWRNDNGDMAYFLPSFIEDPWTGMKAQ